MIAPGTLEALGLVLARTSAMVLASPVLGTGTTFGGVKVGLIAALTLVSWLATGGPTAAPGAGALEFCLLAGREVVIGLALAFVLQAALLTIRVAGHLIGHEMAFAMSQQVDPASGVQTPTVTHLYEVVFTLALLSVDGHLWIVRALSESFLRAPVGVVGGSDGAVSVAVATFGEMFAAGLVFAAPVMVLLATVSVVIGVLARAVPQINVLEFGFNLRVVAGLGGMFLFAPLLAPAIDGLLTQLLASLNSGLDALEVARG
ncbi:MAG: flagellar biosynthetic protein FliR [Planctomycetota bacterium]|nr:flagellar biosynthetic protein FliR [Planctomycetota bacterium]